MYYNTDFGNIASLIIVTILDIKLVILDTDQLGVVAEHTLEPLMTTAKKVTIQCHGDHFNGIICLPDALPTCVSLGLSLPTGFTCTPTVNDASESTLKDNDTSELALKLPTQFKDLLTVAPSNTILPILPISSCSPTRSTPITAQAPQIPQKVTRPMTATP